MGGGNDRGVKLISYYKYAENNIVPLRRKLWNVSETYRFIKNQVIIIGKCIVSNSIINIKIMKKVRLILYFTAIIAASFSVFLTFQTELNTSTHYGGGSRSRNSGEVVSTGTSIDSAKDGGAAGFAILSGLALVAASITYLKNE